MKTFKQIKEQFEVPAIGQTFSRDLMPQLDSGFLKYLKQKNIPFTKETVNTADLKSTQSEFDDMKILNLMSSDNDSTIFISNDDYVLDGHHRWIAAHNTDGKTEAYVIDLPILELYRVAKEYESMLKEEVTHKDFGPMMDSFVSFASDKLGIKSLPKINYKSDDEQGNQPSFGGYNPSSNEIIICTKNRHPMDVFRTLAHELVHHKQNEDGRIKDVAKEGATGSSIEDEANSMAGRLMRWFGKSNPDKFALSHIVESKYTNNSNRGTKMSDLDEACWKGYYQPKKKKLKPKEGSPGQFVPNCVPKKSIDEEFADITEAKKVVNPDKSVFGKALMAAQKMQYAEKQASKGKKGQQRKDYATHYAMQDPVALVKAHIAKHSHKLETKPAAVTPTTHAAPPESPKPMRAPILAPKPSEPKYTAPAPRHMGTPYKRPLRTFDDHVEHYKETGEWDHNKAIATIHNEYSELLADAGNNKEYIKKLKSYYSRDLAHAKRIKRISKGKHPVPLIKRIFGLSEENTPSDREWGTDSLAKIYAEDTPGQSFPPAMYPRNPLFEKKKFVRKKKLEEDGMLGSTLDMYNSPYTLPSKDGIGPEFGNRTGAISGFGTGIQSSIGTGYSYPFGTLAEDQKPMHFKQLREAFDKGIGLLGTVEKSGSNETVDENVDKEAMQCNKPRAQAHGSGETGKSHIVKACANGKEKVIRFGQLGVKGSPKKEGESKSYANRRKRFKARHSKNIAKGKMSAAYWANRVKW